MKVFFALMVLCCVLSISFAQVDKAKWKPQECRKNKFEYPQNLDTDNAKCYKEHGFRDETGLHTKPCVSKCVFTTLGIMDAKENHLSKAEHQEWIKTTLPKYEKEAIKNSDECFKDKAAIKADNDCKELDELFHCFRKDRPSYKC